MTRPLPDHNPILYTLAMAASRQHYERAFESALRRARLPYVLVDDAERAVLPKGARAGLVDAKGRPRRLKSFDAVVYGPQRHALVEVKGRRVDLRKGGSGRRENWVTLDDVGSLTTWQRLFGEPFEAVLVFMYWLDGPVVMAGEHDLHRFEGRTYTHRAVRLADYTAEMKTRSPKWGTVNLPTGVFERLGLPIGDVLSGFRPDLMGDAELKPQGPPAEMALERSAANA